jgi:hypothetical protein
LKSNIAVIAVSIAIAAIWVERGHRLDMTMPIDEFASSIGRTDCPDSDRVPYTASCLEFIEGAADNLRSLTHSTAALVSRDPSKPAGIGLLTPAAACPDNDNRPYTPRCIQFLSGWFWKAN